ncbi:hypothetical protein C2S52_006044 [Perilla frutescens var. hirtella]|nr:hypothetical protein C2S52_006044 [Perilla frutescens var. hirtella]
MAEAVVSVTLETLRLLLVEEAKFYYGVRSEVEGMELELQRMRSFLRDAESRQDSDKRVFNWVSEVREAAYDIEDSVLAYAVAKLASRRLRNSRNIFKKTSTFFKEVVATYRVGSRISNIRTKIAGLTTSLKTYGIKSASDSGSASSRTFSSYGYSNNRDLRRSYSHVVEEDLVGLEKDIGMLVEHLVDGERDRVVSIYGMGGLGKTTIARKMYSHRDVRRHFDGFAWSCITQQWDKRDVMQGILIKLVPERRAEVLEMRDEELVKQLHEVQLKKRCLVVLDDIWSGEAWESLKPAFPNTRNGHGSKMVLTTRNREVVNAVSPCGFVYEPRCLTNEESWELLRKKVFPRREDDPAEFKFDPDMEKLGKEMVGRCRGLPLAIVVLGGLLITKYTLRDWQMVSENINSYLAKGRRLGQQQAVNDVFELSYHDLPYQFKQCFLYLANFPEDFEIEAEKLYQLWLAEGIISQDEKADGETMMDVAERYLAELAQRCMVQVSVKETAGGFKNCRLHDLMRDLCITKAQRENFTRVIDSRRESHASSSKRRRISVYLEPNVADNGVVSSSEYHHIRSAFFYANDSGEEVLLRVKSDLCSFKLLRVVYLHGFRSLHDLPKAIGDLIHLKYLSLSASQFKKLPSSLGKLIYLQTLDLEVDKSLELEIPNVIWKMEQLRHLYLPANFQTEDGAKLRLDGLDNLETLVNFNTSLCDVKDLDRLSNLRKLRAAVKDKLDDDLPSILKFISFTKNQLKRSSLFISCSKFCSDEELNLLRTLLGCHRLHKLSICGHIAKLPEHYHFSSSIAKIAFKASQLDDDPMATLEKLPKLSSLTLYECTYMGEEMVCLSGGFPRLLYLKLWGLPKLKMWRIDEGAMPKLTRLVIAQCEKLEMLPDGLKSIATLQKLNVRGMHDAFKGRLRAENGQGDDFYKVCHVPDIKLD